MAKFIPPIILHTWHLLLLLGAGVAVVKFKSGDFGRLDIAEVIPGCLLAGLTGGVVYCMRGIYINFCVRKKWDSDWIIWHVIRPFVSAICGVVCYFFLQAGLLLLKGAESADFSPYVYYVLAFLAGLNVDKFIKKLEEISKAVIGVEKSKVGEDGEKSQSHGQGR